jgi:hypothetical protein
METAYFNRNVRGLKGHLNAGTALVGKPKGGKVATPGHKDKGK